MPELTPHALKRCSRGDVAAQREAYRIYADRVYRTALHVLGQSADAEDATQDVFLRLFGAADGFDGRSKISTWLYRMTLNHCLNLRKRTRRGPVALPDDCAELPDPDGVSPARESERREAQRQVQDLLDGLAARDRTILVLREIEQLSYLEIAEVLDIPEGTVMSRLSRARARLADVARARSQPQEANR